MSQIIIFDVDTNIETNKDEILEDNTVNLVNDENFRYLWIKSTISSILMQQIADYSIFIIDRLPEFKTSIRNISADKTTIITTLGQNITFDRPIIAKFKDKCLQIPSEVAINIIGILLKKVPQINIPSVLTDHILDGACIAKKDKHLKKIGKVILSGSFGAFNYVQNEYTSLFLNCKLPHLINIGILPITSDTNYTNILVENQHKIYLAFQYYLANTYLMYCNIIKSPFVLNYITKIKKFSDLVF